MNGFFKQCFLRRGNTHQVAWIPEDLAVHGRYVRIKDEDGWLVVCVWQRAAGDRLTPDGRSLRKDFASLN